MITIEDEIIKIFFEVDNKIKEKEYKEAINIKISNSEIITLSIAKELIGKGTDKDFYRSISENYKYLFPNLPHYSKVLKRIKKLSYQIQEIFKIVLEEKKQVYLDTMPIEIVLGVRCNQSKVVREFYRYGIKPDWGHCESKKKKYFGFKFTSVNTVKCFMAYCNTRFRSYNKNIHII